MESLSDPVLLFRAKVVVQTVSRRYCGKDLFLLMSDSTTIPALLHVLFGVCTYKLREEREGKGKREKLCAYTSRQFGNQLDLLAISLLYLVRRLIRGEFNKSLERFQCFVSLLIIQHLPLEYFKLPGRYH